MCVKNLIYYARTHDFGGQKIVQEYGRTKISN